LSTLQPHIFHLKYRPDIDGLRAIAVLAVVVFHAFPNRLQGGFVGVDIFFVISGFLISTIIFNDLEYGSFSFYEFYARRIRRIFPALLTVLVACYFFGWFQLLADEYKQLGLHTMAGAGFASNIVAWNEAGYFDNSIDTKPLLHLWSLGIEEQFYIFWPLVLWVSSRVKLSLFLITTLLTLTSFYLNIKGVVSDPVATFYSPQTRFWELLSGSLLAWVIRLRSRIAINASLNNDLPLLQDCKKKLDCYQILANIFSLLGLSLLIYGVLRISKEVNFPGFWALLPILGSVFVIGAGSKAWVNRYILSKTILVWVGLISFPLYLWHWPLLAFARIVEADTPSVGIRIIALVLSFLLAWLTYRFVERPLRFGGSNKFKVITLIFLMVIVGSAGYTTFNQDGVSFRAMVKKSKDFSFDLTKFKFVECTDRDLIGEDNKDGNCLSVDGESKANIVIFGDSHAQDKFYGLATEDPGNSWMLLWNSSCPPILGVDIDILSKSSCESKNQKTVKWLKANQNIKTVVLSFWGNYFLTEPVAADQIPWWKTPDTINIYDLEGRLKKSRAELFLYGLEETIKQIQIENRRIILLVDIPELPYFPKDCFRKPYKSNCQLNRSDVDSRQLELRKLLLKIKSDYPKVIIYDPIAYFCDDKKCRFEDGEIIFYRDSNHLSLRGSKNYAEQFLLWLKNSP
jgi:peptidoglycan/LPS O-acetylase OafA/YrhL